MFAHRLTGIHALPVELLTRIIVLGAEDDYPYTDSPFLLKPDQNYYAIPSTQFQLTASHVCQHWRHVALRTPSLWTTLYFREYSHTFRAEAYLARCSPNPNRRLDILVDTVAPQDHIPGVTICLDELTTIFSLIMPHVTCWRAFHLKIRDNDCKLLARKNLGGSGPAPNLETLQLYHFEDFVTPQNLYIATYRPPVRIFSNSLPKLRNVSLIGVNLPWEQSPYLINLHALELALHSDSIRPPYKFWDRMLRHSPDLQRLFLHYSGPRNQDGTEDLVWTTLDDGKGKGKEDEYILLESLWELSLTDLDPDYLCVVLNRLVMPNVKKLSLDLPDQDFTPFVELIAPCNLSIDPAQPPAIPHPNQDESYPVPLGSSVHHSYDAVDSYSSSGGDSWATTYNYSTPSSGSSTPVHSPMSSSAHSATSSLGTSVTSPTTTTSISVSPLSNNGSTLFKRVPLPRLATTLETLIITALECELSSWRTLIQSLLVLETLEVNFWKVTVTGHTGDGNFSAWSALVGRVAEEAKVGACGSEVVRRERMVLPRLRRCKLAGLSGPDVRRIISEREGADVGQQTYSGGCERGVEWLVVEDKFTRVDKDLTDVFEKGVWVSEGEDEKKMYWKGRWVKVQRIIEEEEEDEEEDDDEADEEGEADDEQGEEQSRGEDGENEEAEEDMDERDAEEEESAEEDQELTAELDLEVVADKASARGTSTSTFASASESGASVRPSRRNDIHRGTE
ncbi:hypothetical protein P691DRAFT_804231 [Macrolepiota fuliginosa MF-IS2]|uniref:F-box domain-containing protein n=1 Tax=Macrolepiota fuliginosa MF-IS2 TaxID=1400762 RepID=A0A9P6CAC8_9AGAR|nr:hypothetical protein P691DRAFT_804231 [Macrolepiota fuliginosa MF-IS2]